MTRTKAIPIAAKNNSQAVCMCFFLTFKASKQASHHPRCSHPSSTQEHPVSFLIFLHVLFSSQTSRRILCLFPLLRCLHLAFFRAVKMRPRIRLEVLAACFADSEFLARFQGLEVFIPHIRFSSRFTASVGNAFDTCRLALEGMHSFPLCACISRRYRNSWERMRICRKALEPFQDRLCLSAHPPMSDSLSGRDPNSID